MIAGLETKDECIIVSMSCLTFKNMKSTRCSLVLLDLLCSWSQYLGLFKDFCSKAVLAHVHPPAHMFFPVRSYFFYFYYSTDIVSQLIQWYKDLLVLVLTTHSHIPYTHQEHQVHYIRV